MLGHIPSESPDTVINVMFLFLFSVAGIGHAMVFLGNKFSGRKFIITAMPSGEQWVVKECWNTSNMRSQLSVS